MGIDRIEKQRILDMIDATRNQLRFVNGSKTWTIKKRELIVESYFDYGNVFVTMRYKRD